MVIAASHHHGVSLVGSNAGQDIRATYTIGVFTHSNHMISCAYDPREILNICLAFGKSVKAEILQDNNAKNRTERVDD